MPSAFINGNRVPYAREAVGTLTTAKSLTAATYNTGSGVGTTYNHYDKVSRPELAMIQVKTADINWTVNGTAPTAAAGTDVGFVSQPGDFITLEGYATIAGFQCINTVNASGATIEVTYFK